MRDHTLESVCRTLRNGPVVEFVRATVRAGYRELLPAPEEQIDRLVDAAFDRLALSQQAGIDAPALAAAASDLVQRAFRKGEEAFWFNRSYHRYKTQSKPDVDFRRLRGLIAGRRVLDYGCGSGYLAARLARAGYAVSTADVIDYRYAEARDLPFVRMASATDIPFPDGSIDTALVQAVLHHIDPQVQPVVLRRLARIAGRVLIKEDTYDLPPGLPGLAEALEGQPLLREFVRLPRESQLEALILIDYFSNAIAQGLPEMNMPFSFHSVTEWKEVLEACGLPVAGIQVAGFEPGRLHKSCHAWFVCERIG